MASERGRQTGARSIGEDKKRGGWLWWLLALLLLIAAIILLSSLLGGDDDDDRASSTQTQTQESTPPPADEAAPSSETGTLTSGGQSLLPATPAVLEGAAGQPAEGQGVEVQSVVRDEGFWVGTSEEDRVYVEFGGDVGEDEQSASTYEPTVGDTVDLTGEVRPAPEDPAQTLNLSEQDGQQVSEQGAYVNAETVEPR